MTRSFRGSSNSLHAPRPSSLFEASTSHAHFTFVCSPSGCTSVPVNSGDASSHQPTSRTRRLWSDDTMRCSKTRWRWSDDTMRCSDATAMEWCYDAMLNNAMAMELAMLRCDDKKRDGGGAMERWSDGAMGTVRFSKTRWRNDSPSPSRLVQNAIVLLGRNTFVCMPSCCTSASVNSGRGIVAVASTESRELHLATGVPCDGHSAPTSRYTRHRPRPTPFVDPLSNCADNYTSDIVRYSARAKTR